MMQGDAAPHQLRYVEPSMALDGTVPHWRLAEGKT